MTVTTATRTVAEAIDHYVAHLNIHPASLALRTGGDDVNGHEPWYQYTAETARRGQRFTRVACRSMSLEYGSQGETGAARPGQRMVHCFIENATGLVFKSAGWTGPVKTPAPDLRDSQSRAALYHNSTHSGHEFYAGFKAELPA